MNLRHKFQQFLHMFIEDVDFEDHGRLGVFPSMIVTIVLFFCVDANEEILEIPACVSEGRFRRSEKDVEQSLHNRTTD